MTEGITIARYKDKLDSFLLQVYVIDLEKALSSPGDPWNGWEDLEAHGISKEEFGKATRASLADEIEDYTGQDRLLVIDGEEALELQEMGKIRGVTLKINTLFIFGEDNMFLLNMVGRDAWEEIERTWDMIKKSIELR